MWHEYCIPLPILWKYATGFDLINLESTSKSLKAALTNEKVADLWKSCLAHEFKEFDLTLIHDFKTTYIQLLSQKQGLLTFIELAKASCVFSSKNLIVITLLKARPLIEAKLTLGSLNIKINEKVLILKTNFLPSLLIGFNKIIIENQKKV